MHGKTVKPISQITFDDPGAGQYRSLYLGTLVAEARSKPRPHSANPSSDSNRPIEGYTHGTLSTAGIEGASPAIHSLTKQAAQQRDKLLTGGATPEAAANQAANAAGGRRSAAAATAAADADSGMQPRVRIPASSNRPDLIHDIHDIEGAQPNPRNVIKNPRKTNPLSPEYKLSAGAAPLPSGPAPVDKLLGDPLRVSDIPGASRSPRRARSPGIPQQLDVSDIEGTNSKWKPPHRQLAAFQPRDTALNVSDINTYMARFKPGARETSYKGHPEGPRVPSPVKPRHVTNEVDNSLRTADIQGTRPVSPYRSVRVRTPHQLTTSVADIEGTAPTVKDKLLLFERKKAAAAAAVADAAAGQAVLSGIVLEPADLAVIWNKCSKLDKDKSGYLTAAELDSALKSSQLHLPADDRQRLLTALKDNAGLLNYKKLTKQLKGRLSRPSSAQPHRQQQHLVQPQQQEQLSRPAAGKPSAYQVDGSAAASGQQQLQEQQQGQVAHTWQQADSSSPSRRPTTAPARTQRLAGVAANNPVKPGVAFDDVNLWFGGSSRDKESAAEARAWSPTRALEQTLESAILTKVVPYPGEEEGTADTVATAASAAAEAGSKVSQQQDMLPGWVIGADAVHGTFKVVQPFSNMLAAPGAAEPEPAAAVGPSRISGTAGEAIPQMASKQRPASAGPSVGRASSSRQSRPASAGFSNSGGGSISIVPSDAGFSVAERPGSSSGIRSELMPAEASTGSERPALLQRPRSAAAAVRRPGSAGTAAQSINRLNERASSVSKPASTVLGSLGAARARNSGGSVLGLAERRRFHEGVQQDLAAVRMLQ